jgi:hypothetical protein
MGSSAWIWLRPTLDHWGTILPTGKAEETEAMPDVRPIHRHAATLYGSRGPQQILGNELPHDRPLTSRLRWHEASTEPQSLIEHLQAAAARVPGLSSAERRAVVNVMLERCRDLSFVRMICDQTPGWTGRPQDEGRPL